MELARGRDHEPFDRAIDVMLESPYGARTDARLREHFDRLVDRINAHEVTALAQGGAITAGIAFLIGFLQIFNVVGSIDIFWFGTLFFLSYGLSVCLQQFAKTV